MSCRSWNVGGYNINNRLVEGWLEIHCVDKHIDRQSNAQTVTNPQTALLDLPIFSNDDGQREAEADDLLLVVGAEGSDASDGQLVDRSHPLVAIAVILAWAVGLLLCSCVNLNLR